MTPIIGLVSGTHNRLSMLKNMVQSFRDNLLPGLSYTITIVDAGSTDGTLEWLAAQSDIQVIADGKRWGAISAFTRGAQATDAKYILLANDDIQFFDNSIMPAIVHLENHMRCGAVAFADNRVVSGIYSRSDYKVLAMGAIKPVEVSDGYIHPRDLVELNGKRYRNGSVHYAQVGLFRKWLGDKVKWWLGEHEEMKGARTYGGDNMLSASIWNYGYSVDIVPQCRVEDYVAEDELRAYNREQQAQSDDSQYFYKAWPHGVIVNNEPQIPQQDRRAARILYLPIYEPGWPIQKHPVHGKHGLREALARGHNKYSVPHIVQEYDYLAANPQLLRAELLQLVDNFQPDLILSQLQSPKPITAPLLAELRKRSGATIVNWNGDQAPGGLGVGSPEMLDVLRHVDLQLITNLDAVETYDREHIKWAYWQIGYEMPEGDINEHVRDYFMELGRENPCQDDTQYPVVYLANLRSAERQQIASVVNEFGGHVFQPGDDIPTLYNFSTTAWVYQHAKIAISDNGFTSKGFVSNRLFQALAAGGCIVLQQHVDMLDELTGLQAGFHYGEWHDLDELRKIIADTLSADEEFRQVVANFGTKFVRENFSFDAQVAKLMTIIKERLGESEQLTNAIALKYVGRNGSGFGLGNDFPSGFRYEHEAGKLLYVKPEDVEHIFARYPNQWERMNV